MSKSIWELLKASIAQNNTVDYAEKAWDFLSDEDLTEFVATAITGGAGTVIDTVNGGVCQLAAAATTDNSGANLQADASYLTLGLGRKVLLWGRIALYETTSTNADVQSDCFFGLFVKADTDLTGAVVDGVYFRKDDGDANIDTAVMGASSLSGDNAVGTMVTGGVFKDFLVYIEMDPTVAARGFADFYLNGTKISRVNSGAFPLVTVILSPGAEFNSGDNTGTKNMHIDFIKVLFTR